MITNSIKYVGVNDHKIDLFEGQFTVPNGMAYNSYLIVDEKTAVMDSVDIKFTDEWLDNILLANDNKEPDFLIVQHMEPDHSASILAFMEKFKNAIIVSSNKAFTMMNNYYKTQFESRRIIINEGNTLKLGKHTLTFICAPMVHWPEVIMTYDDYDKVLFSADGFGKFGALDREEDWLDEARRYYFGIVGKYGQQVQMVLKKASNLNIKIICPLHGPVLDKNIKKYVSTYNTWSTYTPEIKGVLIAYTSVYGHTKNAAMLLKDELEKRHKKVEIYDLARSDWSEVVSKAFKYDKLVLATTTYNGEIYPFMREFLDHLIERGFKNRKVGIIENGSWLPMAGKCIKSKLEVLNDITYTNTQVKILSELSVDNLSQIKQLAKEL